MNRQCAVVITRTGNSVPPPSSSGIFLGGNRRPHCAASPGSHVNRSAGSTGRDLLRLTASHQDTAARDERGQLPGGARRTPDLQDVVLVLLGTGMRIETALDLEWADLNLRAGVPFAWVAATLVEPRRDVATGQVFVSELHGHSMTKTGAARSIALPSAAVEMLN